MIEIRGKGSGLMYIIGLSESGGRLLERIFSSLRGLGLNAARRFAIRPRPLETTTALAQSSQAKIALPYEQRQPSQLSDNVGHGRVIWRRCSRKASRNGTCNWPGHSLLRCARTCFFSKAPGLSRTPSALSVYTQERSEWSSFWPGFEPGRGVVSLLKKPGLARARVSCWLVSSIPAGITEIQLCFSSSLLLFHATTYHSQCSFTATLSLSRKTPE
jgi:hypothetical protein